MAAKSSTEMSEWIKFFTAAGIPPGAAAKYAMTFMDNRIQKSMLMDLTKEYLTDMGVGVMGDVICILKYAKSAYSQYERERPLLEAMPQPQDGKIELKRQTTPGNRMLEHYMRREGILEDNPKVKVSTAMATRLGAVPSTGSKKHVMGIPGSVEVVPVKKARRVPPEEEGSYIISLPKGSTERTKKILNQKVAKDTNNSVFARLGAGSPGAAAVGTTSTAGMMATKAKSASTGKQTGSPTVFNRLGGQSTTSSPTSPVLQYHGVLKSSPHSSPSPKVVAAAIPRAKKVAAVQERLGVQRPEVSTTTLTHMDAVGLKHSLQARLGSQKSETSAVAPEQISVIIGNVGKPAGSKKSTGIMSRLGSQKAASKPKQIITQKPSVSKRLGDKKNSSRLSLTPKGNSGGVMARLGQKQSTTSAVTLAPTVSKVQKRLGLPVKSSGTPKVSLKERLGLQKAEASSTTPSFTVTLGGTPVSKNLQGSARKRKRKSGSSQVQTPTRSVAMGQDVFSRLGSG